MPFTMASPVLLPAVLVPAAPVPGPQSRPKVFFMDVRPQFRPATGSSLQIDITRLSDLRGLLDLSEALGFSGQTWRKVIADSTAVCAKDAGGIVGFCVANHLPFTCGDQLHELRAAMAVLSNRFRLDEANIAFGAQTVVAAPYETTNLRAQMLRALLRTIGLRYQHLFTFCRKQDSAELDTLLWEGWRCFQEEDATCYLALDVAKTLRRLASELVLRAPLSAQSHRPQLPIRS